jgi:hypothetical protein
MLVEIATLGPNSHDLPKVLLMQTAQAIPCSRWMVGKTSAEYWNATGPSPNEYMMVKRYTNKMTGPTLEAALALSGCSSDRPAASRKIHMRGNVFVKSVTCLNAVTENSQSDTMFFGPWYRS